MSACIPTPSLTYGQDTVDVSCYGFIIPLPQGTDTSNETLNNSLVRHLINDLLRENLDVYWLITTTQFSVLPLDGAAHNDLKTIQQGAFFVPFTTEAKQNALLTALIYDYNHSHELGIPIHGQVEAYLVTQQVTFQGRSLVEPKIAQHLGTPIRYGWPSYLQIADAGGFLSMEFLLDNETHLLTNEAYNVFIWPYLPDPATYQEQLATFSNLQGVNAVRSFVKKGGGYLGTCYGAYAASSGFIFSPLVPLTLSHAYTPMRSQQIPLLSLAISDTLLTVHPDVLLQSYLTTIQAVNASHPVFFGVNATITDFLKSPLFFWHGPHTTILGIFSDVYPRNESTSIRNRTKTLVIGRAAWVESSFGDGIMVLFGTHPDFINNITPLFQNRTWNGDPYYGRRIIHNALLHVTAEETVQICPENTLSLSQIENIRATTDISLFPESSNEFFIEKKIMKKLMQNLTVLQSTTAELQRLFEPYEINNSLYAESSRLLRYTNWYCDIYNDYVNRTIMTLTLLDHVLYAFSNQGTPLDNLSFFHRDLAARLQHADRLLSSAQKRAILIQEKMENLTITPQVSFELLKDRRQLLQTTETLLKYVPTLYFVSLKTLRHLFYQYEADLVLKMGKTCST